MTAARAAPGALAPGRRLLITVSVMTATIMQVLDITIANVSLPYMQGSLSATLDQVSWVLTSYVVAAAVMTAPVGWLAARFGIKKLFVVCVVGFTAASVLCGIAQSIEEIVLYRVVQGSFGAALVPLSQTVMLDIYPPERRNWAMTLWGLGVMIGPIMGPILGGWLTEHYSWRWVFFINVPVGIGTALGLVAFMDETEGDARLPFDWLGFAALGIAIGALQLMLDRGEQLGWFDAGEIVITAAVSAAAFYVFLAHTLTTPQPFISIDIFRDINFVVGLAFMFVCGMLLVATLAVMAPFLQGVMGFPIVDVGLLLGTRGIGMAIGLLGAGRLIMRTDPRLILGLRPRLLRGVALLHHRLLARHRRLHHRLDQHPARHRPRRHVRAAQHAGARLAAAGAAHPGHRHVDLDPQPGQLDRRVHRHRQPHQQDHRDACAPGRERHALQSGAGRPGRRPARPQDRDRPRAAGAAREPAGDHHRLQQQLQADDGDDAAGLPAHRPGARAQGAAAAADSGFIAAKQDSRKGSYAPEPNEWLTEGVQARDHALHSNGLTRLMV